MALANRENSNSSFQSMTISLASPESILKRSRGEVTKPETINYRTYKPERDGLFCEKIFGPVKDWECSCGKYKRIRYKGIVCDRCGVEVTEKKVRRERMGHIQLVVPVAHIWFFRSLPNKIGALIGLQSKKLEQVIYYEKYVVINPGVAEKDGVNKLDLLIEEEYQNILENLPEENQYLPDDDPNKFVAKMGGDALYELLRSIDINALSYQLRDAASRETSMQRKKDTLKRLNVVESFRESMIKMEQRGLENRPEWMVVKVVPVIPPDLRPLVPLDGGRFATSDLNDLYRRVIIRNNRLKRLLDIKAPDVIMRNEKRMLQESVDSLFDNSRKVSSVRSDSNRALKSLSDSLKGKQGRFRQNLLGKRVDYSGRSVIVVGPDLKMYECGLPKDMATELFKPFIIRKILERGIVKTVKSAKRIVDKKEPVVIEILENLVKGHPVLLNRAPTLHRLGIQAFQPKLVEGKAIRLHPLVCTGFNADFDGDQMAVHLPLGNAAVLEAQLLMLSSHNILNPANGAPITVPSQDMILGLYYMTKERKTEGDDKVFGEGKSFYSIEDVQIAYNEKKIDLHAGITLYRNSNNEQLSYIVYFDKKAGTNNEGICIGDRGYFDPNGLKLEITDADVLEKKHGIHTTVGRVLFNRLVPDDYGYVNKLIKKNVLRDIIGGVLKTCGSARTVQFLDDIKDKGYYMAFKGGLSFNLADVIVPEEKIDLIEQAEGQVDEVTGNYQMGFITDRERYNQVIDIWTTTNRTLANHVLKQMAADRQGFNSVYMMLDSGARGSKEQIRQLSGMRGLMAKPQKAGSGGAEIIENPIISNFKEGLNVLEYFISTHGARKGLADTALKTADAGYLTRRLVDVAHDVIITQEDCGTLRGIPTRALVRNDEEVQSLYDRILGRVTLHDIIHPQTGELIAREGDELTEDICQKIQESPIEEVEIRSVLTCEATKGVCAKCYGRNLATGKLVQRGESVGVIAAQAIGEPGTQLTLRTFHVGGVASGDSATIHAKYDGIVHFDSSNLVPAYIRDKDDKGNYFSKEYLNDSDVRVYREMGSTCEMQVIDKSTGSVLQQAHIQFGAYIHVQEGEEVKAGQAVAVPDLYSSHIIAAVEGKVKFFNIIEGTTFRSESDPQTGLIEKIITETKQKGIVPSVGIIGATYQKPRGVEVLVQQGQEVKEGTVLFKIEDETAKNGFADVVSEIAGTVDLSINADKETLEAKKLDVNIIIKSYDMPAGAHLNVEDGEVIKPTITLATKARASAKAGDITGGLPRVTELFEARNPSDQAVIAEIDGVVSFGKKLKRGNREVIITGKTGEQVSYLIPTSRQILAQENDYVKAGTPISEGEIAPADILNVLGPLEVQKYIVNEAQDVYRLQGVKINDKHFEVIVRQMMRKVEIDDAGDTQFLEAEAVNKIDFQAENDKIYGMQVVTDCGDSENYQNGQMISMRELRDENSSLVRQDKKTMESRDAKPATAHQILQGITRASLQTKSFLSAASFQETTKVLTEAAISAKEDNLLGMKENVLVGHLIPAGTGLREYENVFVANKEQLDRASKAGIQSVRRGRKK
ncbi:MAG: DNA-directed RNA polymerase subunit beta' [Bacteroidales bacterium]|nr:DNA-directed RNA polymerase subunit beta' [Bacteroidales bacterium]